MMPYSRRLPPSMRAHPDEAIGLRLDVAAEPLVHGFYVWPYNLAPATGAMVFVRRIIPMLESYLAAPELHLEAASDPRLRAGPFVDVPRERAPEVRALLERLHEATAAGRAFAEAFEALRALVSERARGHGLDALYPEIPSPLQGLVELAYDLRDRPQIRLVEALAYRSPLYDRSAQSVALERVHADRDRSFTLSTPRLPGPGRVLLPWTLDDPRLDRLFGTRLTPSPRAALLDALELDGDARGQVDRMLGPVPPLPPDRHYRGPGVRVRYFGHACLVIQTARVDVVVDPFVSHDVADPDRLTLRDLPDHIDWCLITHGHQDHLVLETLLPLRGRIERLVIPSGSNGSLQDPSLRLYLQHLGFSQVIEAHELDHFSVPGGELLAAPFLGEHCDLDVRAKLTWFLTLEGRTIHAGADARGLAPALYDRLHRIVPAVDAAFVGMECDGAPLSWLYGPLLAEPGDRQRDASRTLSGSNAREALEIVTRLGARRVLVYAMGRERWLSHVLGTYFPPDAIQLREAHALCQACEDRGIPAQQLLGRADLFL